MAGTLKVRGTAHPGGGGRPIGATKARWVPRVGTPAVAGAADRARPGREEAMVR